MTCPSIKLFCPRGQAREKSISPTCAYLCRAQDYIHMTLLCMSIVAVVGGLLGFYVYGVSETLADTLWASGGIAATLTLISWIITSCYDASKKARLEDQTTTQSSSFKPPKGDTKKEGEQEQSQVDVPSKGASSHAAQRATLQRAVRSPLPHLKTHKFAESQPRPRRKSEPTRDEIDARESLTDLPEGFKIRLDSLTLSQESILREAPELVKYPSEVGMYRSRSRSLGVLSEAAARKSVLRPSEAAALQTQAQIELFGTTRNMPWEQIVEEIIEPKDPFDLRKLDAVWERALKLIEEDPSRATEVLDDSTILQYAASAGKVDFVKAIIRYCPPKQRGLALHNVGMCLNAFRKVTDGKTQAYCLNLRSLRDYLTGPLPPYKAHNIMLAPLSQAAVNAPKRAEVPHKEKTWADVQATILKIYSHEMSVLQLYNDNAFWRRVVALIKEEPIRALELFGVVRGGHAMQHTIVDYVAILGKTHTIQKIMRLNPQVELAPALALAKSTLEGYQSNIAKWKKADLPVDPRWQPYCKKIEQLITQLGTPDKSKDRPEARLEKKEKEKDAV